MMKNIFEITAMGYLTGLSGFLPGSLFSGSVKNVGNRIMTLLRGFSAGLLLSVVCFTVLPAVFARMGLYMSVGILAVGMLTAVLSEGKMRDLKAAGSVVPLSASLLMYSAPGGVAIGALFSFSIPTALLFSGVMAVYCCPAALFTKLSKKTSRLILPFAAALPMGVAALIGCMSTHVSAWAADACISLSAGILLYTGCGEIAPSRACKSIFPAVGALVGFIVGVALSIRVS